MTVADQITTSFAEPFYTGTVGVAPSISGKAVSIADHWYLLDLKSERFRYASVQAIRPQADTSEVVGEQSLSRDGLWRKVISSWHHGADQAWYDRANGDPLRFRASRGIDPWTEWQLSLLPSVTEVATEATGWNSLAVGEFTAGQRLVAGGGNGKCITVTPALGLSTVLGLSGICVVTGNGSAVYVADNTDIWLINAAGTGVTSFNANVNAATVLGFVKNRLLAGVGAALWNVVDGATATPHFTNPWPGWTWTGFAEGETTIYASGFAGDRSLIFSVPINAAGTGLDQPRVALELPHGEIALSIVGYVGFVVIGTNKGVRVAQQEADGGLTMGAVVGDSPARCLEPQDTFVWFGWDATFPDGAGLGRIDLTRFVQPLAPAHATDLISPTTGVVTAVITFDNRRWFAVGTKVYVQSATMVGEGFLETGMITYNIIDTKVAVSADLRHDALMATESIEFHHRNLDHMEYELHGVSNQVGATRPLSLIPGHHQRSSGHEIKVILKRGSDPTGPVLTGLTLASQPSPQRSFNVYLPLLIHSSVSLDESGFMLDVPGEVAFLRRLVDTQQLVRFTSGSISHLVFVEDYEWVPHHSTQDQMSFDGTVILKLKSAELAEGGAHG